MSWDGLWLTNQPEQTNQPTLTQHANQSTNQPTNQPTVGRYADDKHAVSLYGSVDPLVYAASVSERCAFIVNYTTLYKEECFQRRPQVVRKLLVRACVRACMHMCRACECTHAASALSL